jgi:hypothetical protein
MERTDAPQDLLALANALVADQRRELFAVHHR